MESQMELPEFEVIVRRNQSDEAIVSFFRGSAGSHDCVVGLASLDDRRAILVLLEAAFDCLTDAEVWEYLPSVFEDEQPF